jgi:PAS domain S-box-containing protein
MEAQLEHPADEVKRLQRCMNDLLSVLALPAMWSGGEPSQIVHTLPDALLAMLQLDLIYVRLKDPAGGSSIEIVRVVNGFVHGSRQSMLRPQEIGEVLNHWLGDDLQKWPPLVRKRIGDEEFSIAPVRLGLHGEIGIILAGSRRADFPAETEKLLLSVAANQASIGLQEARLLSQQKRLANELDQRVAQRTAQLAEANEELRKEITERRRAEEKLRRSEDRLRTIIDTIPTIAWRTAPDGAGEYWNQRWHDYTGVSLDAPRGWGWQAVIHPEDASEITDAWLRHLASGQAGEVEGRLRRFDGEYRWFLFRFCPLRDESGNIVNWYGTNIDIEDRKRADAALKRSQAFLAEGQRLSLTGSFSWRVDTDEITFSDELHRIFAFEQDSPVTLERIGTRVHPEDIPLLSEKIERARAGSHDLEYEIRLRMPDDSVKYLHTVAHGSRDREGRLEFIGAVQDVTQRRSSEEALSKARSDLAHVSRVTSLGVLTASIAHEVNQPLSGIITNASTCLRMLAADPPNVDGARETARRTIRDGNRASEVVTRLRALYSKKDVTADSMNLNEATREVIALSLSELQRNSVILRAELADDLPPVAGDRVQLQQVILNLIRNGSDAMSGVNDRPRQLLVRTERDEGDRVRLTVRDVGIGFDLQTADRLFETFYTTKNDGMGIGLSVSRSIIECHHGRLWGTRNDGPGATFSFSIPCGPEGATGTNSYRDIRGPDVTATEAA